MCDFNSRVDCCGKFSRIPLTSHPPQFYLFDLVLHLRFTGTSLHSCARSIGLILNFWYHYTASNRTMVISFSEYFHRKIVFSFLLAKMQFWLLYNCTVVLVNWILIDIDTAWVDRNILLTQSSRCEKRLSAYNVMKFKAFSGAYNAKP